MTTNIAPSIQLPWTQRINFRLWIVLVLAAVAVGYPLYEGLLLAFNGGIRDSSDDRGAILKVDLYSMSRFEIDHDLGEMTDIPKKWRELDGKRVELAGEIPPGLQVGGELTRFDLVFSITKCCIDGPPKMQHFVHCSTAQGKTVRYYQGLVIVKGILHVGIERDPDTGKIHSIYKLDVESTRQG